jgi:hypothetical protein
VRVCIWSLQNACQAGITSNAQGRLLVSQAVVTYMHVGVCCASDSYASLCMPMPQHKNCTKPSSKCVPA